MPYKHPNGDLGNVFFREDHSMWEPISRRASTLQERLLSPRALFYGSRLSCSATQLNRVMKALKTGHLMIWDLAIEGSLLGFLSQ